MDSSNATHGNNPNPSINSLLEDICISVETPTQMFNLPEKSIKLLDFQRLVGGILKDLQTETKMQTMALELLHFASEDYLIRSFKKLRQKRERQQEERRRKNIGRKNLRPKQK